MTSFLRYKSLDKVGEYRAILLEGALLMLEHNEINSGSDLALLLVDDYISKHVEPTEENIAPLLKIFAAYKKDLHPRKFIFMRKCIEWSSREDNNNQGHPLLHNTFAKYFASLEEYESAQNHFIRGSDPEAYAEILIEWAKTGYPSEFDLYIARAVLMYLCLSNLKDANIVFEKYVQLQDKEIDTPLLHFIMFLLLALERDALPLFDLLRQKYKKSISRDPSFDQVWFSHIFVNFKINVPSVFRSHIKYILRNK